MTSPLEQASHKMNATMHRVNCDYLQALGEVAGELGGEEFADETLTASITDSNVFSFDGLVMLEQRYPEATDIVHDRVTEIMEERRAVEHEALRQRFQVKGLRGWGRLAMRGFQSIHL